MAAVGWRVLFSEDAADYGDGVAESSINIEAEDNRNSRFDVRKDGAVDGRASETKRLIAGFTDRTNHPFGGEEFRSGGKGNGLGCGRRRSELRDVRHGNPVVAVPVLPPSSVATPCLTASVSWPACVGERH